MAAGLRAVLESADLVDLVLEVRDARLPKATAVVHLHRRLRTKPRIVLLNREDLADRAVTRAWVAALAKKEGAFSAVGTSAASLRPLRAALLAQKPRRGHIRVAVVGAPNTGKSSVINGLVRRKSAVTQNKPGVTKRIRWISLDCKVDVLDTPGVLEPRISSDQVTWQLALCGILPESAFDIETVATQFAAWLGQHHPQAAAAIGLETFARQRGMLRRGGEPDRLNAARRLVKEFRAGTFGRITFEEPQAAQ